MSYETFERHDGSDVCCMHIDGKGVVLGELHGVQWLLTRPQPGANAPPMLLCYADLTVHEFEPAGGGAYGTAWYKLQGPLPHLYALANAHDVLLAVFSPTLNISSTISGFMRT